jgi:hypothetical protein
MVIYSISNYWIVSSCSSQSWALELCFEVIKSFYRPLGQLNRAWFAQLVLWFEFFFGVFHLCVKVVVRVKRVHYFTFVFLFLPTYVNYSYLFLTWTPFCCSHIRFEVSHFKAIEHRKLLAMDHNLYLNPCPAFVWSDKRNHLVQFGQFTDWD